MAYPITKNDPELLEIKTRDDEINDSKYESGKYDHEKILKSLKNDKDF